MQKTEYKQAAAWASMTPEEWNSPDKEKIMNLKKENALISLKEYINEQGYSCGSFAQSRFTQSVNENDDNYYFWIVCDMVERLDNER